jgi:hypothetical protein
MMQVARARKASGMSSRRSHRMRSRFMPWYQAMVRSITHRYTPARAVRLAAAGDAWADAFGSYGFAVLVVVVGAVGVQLVGAPAWPTAASAYRWDLVDQRE